MITLPVNTPVRLWDQELLFHETELYFSWMFEAPVTTLKYCASVVLPDEAVSLGTSLTESLDGYAYNVLLDLSTYGTVETTTTLGLGMFRLYLGTGVSSINPGLSSRFNITVVGLTV